MKALVTGAPGWLGTRLVEILRNKSYQIRCLALPSLDSTPLEALGAEVVRGDLTMPRTLDGICKGIKTVFHCAGVIHPKKINELFNINTHGTKNLIEEAAKSGVDKFIYVSSNSVAGCNLSHDILMKEEDPPRPYMNYGLSKHKAEEIVKDFHKKGRIKTVILRPCWYYGTGQPARQTRFFRMIKKGKPIMFGNGKNLRSMSYIDNVIQGLLLAEEKDKANGKTYWIADKRPYPTIEIYQTIAKLLGVDLKPLYVPSITSKGCELADTLLQSFGLYSQEIHVAGEMIKGIACSIEKAERELGYKPEVDLEEGMRRSMVWCRKNGIDV